MKLKRYQIWSREGLTWSNWFPFIGLEEEKWQIKNKQLNEYKEVTEEEWKHMSGFNDIIAKKKENINKKKNKKK